MDYNEFVNDHLDNANGHLDSFDGAPISLEKGGHSREMVRNLLGTFHMLKGNPGMMGFNSLKGHVHNRDGRRDNEQCVARCYRSLKVRKTVVPAPTVLSISMVPLWSSIILRHMGRPRPVPSFLVVKNGSNTLSRASG